MHLFDNINIEEFKTEKGSWLLNYDKEFYVIDINTKFLLSTIKKHKSLEKSLDVFNTKMKTSLSIEEFKEFVESILSKFNLSLNQENIDNRKPSQGYVKNKILLLNTNICKKITKPFYFLFEKKVFYTLLILSVLLITLFVNNYKVLSHLNTSGSILKLILITLPGVILHELGHIASCEKYKVDNGGIGIGRYLFFPVFYSDVTGIWKLNKKDRIVVNLSGVYFQLLYILLLIGIFIITKEVLFITAILVLFFDIAFQLLPFLRSDGYWVLSDITGIHNLRKKSLKIVTRLFEIRTKKEVFLFFYGALNISIIGYYLYRMVVKNSHSFLNYPKEVYKLIMNTFTLNFEKIAISPSFLLYTILYLFIWKLTLKTIKSLEKKAGIFSFDQITGVTSK